MVDLIQKATEFNRDSMGMYMEALKETNENIDIRYGCINSKTNDLKWFFLSHHCFDGLSGFLTCINNYSYFKSKKLPVIKKIDRFSYLAFVKFLIQYILLFFSVF
jgi:hypothetical protein